MRDLKVKYAVWENIDGEFELFNTKEEADKCAQGIIEHMQDYSTDGWEGSENIVVLEVLEEYGLVDITDKYRAERELGPDDELPNGFDYISELQQTYSRPAKITQEDWHGMYQVAADRADKAEAALIIRNGFIFADIDTLKAENERLKAGTVECIGKGSCALVAELHAENAKLKRVAESARDVVAELRAEEYTCVMNLEKVLDELGNPGEKEGQE